MTQRLTKTFIIIIVTSLVLGTLLVPTSAQSIDCGDAEPQIDLFCQRKKLLQPSYNCQLLYCSDQPIPSGGGDEGEIIETNIFGVKIRVNSDQTLVSFFYIGFSMFLGVVALATVFLGLYAAYKRSQTTSDEDIAAAQKILTNAVIGFVLIGMSLLFVQLLASFLGLGSITDMVDFSGILTPQTNP